MAELLLFNIQDPEKKTAIRLTALRLGLLCREIPPERQGETLEALLTGEATDTAPVEGETFTDELLLMHALPQAEFHELLERLHRELCAEEEAMQRWKQQTKNKKHKKK